ncbi:hypothetical protein DFH05DRAFT_1616439 [Lentinula detonsa]|uniref:Uncharacterized protein n=1 Tax=Lentinula detonsa TaxID=2804962 RepID=A0A9W8P007_9AGAR|nr:hypothetical protein DFH05DRAFT_1616439 [Lentinula detonsa]
MVQASNGQRYLLLILFSSCSLEIQLSGPGRLTQILATENPQANSIMLIEQFNVLAEKNNRLNMPIMTRSDSTVAVMAQDILFDFNAQHDCVFAGCTVGESDNVIVQERIRTSQCKKCIVHAEETRYIINMHALHNAHLIREALPRQLIQPIPSKTDRVAFHKNLSAQLQVSGDEKRAATQAKAAETRKRKKAAQVTAAMIE